MYIPAYALGVMIAGYVIVSLLIIAILIWRAPMDPTEINVPMAGFPRPPAPDAPSGCTEVPTERRETPDRRLPLLDQLSPSDIGVYDARLANSYDPVQGVFLELCIDKCSDPSLWYAGLVGRRVPLKRVDRASLEYISREPSGFTNVVKFGDATVMVKGGEVWK